MPATLTIRNLDEGLKRKLRVRAAGHGRSMEAEIRAILKQVIECDLPQPPTTAEQMRDRLLAARGIWQPTSGPQSTAEIMRELRGDD